MKQALDLFADVEPFLHRNEEISPANCRHLLEIFDPESLQKLHLEPTVVIDAGVHFVNATYYQGDGPLLFSCCERLSAIAHAFAVDHYPNTEAVAREIAHGNAALFNRLIAQTKAYVPPGLNFYQQKFSVQFHDTVRAFKAARLCCPVQVQALRATAATLEELAISLSPAMMP